MDKELRLDHPLPDDVLAAAHALYAGPTDAAYWASLESRVMARVAEQASAPTLIDAAHHFPQHRQQPSWVRTGLMAAAALLVAISALFMRSHTDEIRAAYDSLVKPVPAESLELPSGTLGTGEGKQGTLQDAILR